MPHERWRILPVTQSPRRTLRANGGELRENEQWKMAMPPSRNPKGVIAMTDGRDLSWKQSYICSVKDALRTRLTDQELTHFTWSITFHFQTSARTPCTRCYFYENRQYEDINFNAESAARWSLEDRTLFMNSLSHSVSRTPDWGWQMGHQGVQMRTEPQGWTESVRATQFRQQFLFDE